MKRLNEQAEVAEGLIDYNNVKIEEEQKRQEDEAYMREVCEDLATIEYEEMLDRTYPARTYFEPPDLYCDYIYSENNDEPWEDN